MNLRPSGYEPDELPDCSTPRRVGHLTPPGEKHNGTRALCSQPHAEPPRPQEKPRAAPRRRPTGVPASEECPRASRSRRLFSRRAPGGQRVTASLSGNQAGPRPKRLGPGGPVRVVVKERRAEGCQPQVWPLQLRSDQVVPDQVVPDQVVSDHVAPDQVVPNQLAPDHVVPDQVVPFQVPPDQVVPWAAAADQVVPFHGLP